MRESIVNINWVGFPSSLFVNTYFTFSVKVTTTLEHYLSSFSIHLVEFLCLWYKKSLSIPSLVTFSLSLTCFIFCGNNRALLNSFSRKKKCRMGQQVVTLPRGRSFSQDKLMMGQY